MPISRRIVCRALAFNGVEDNVGASEVLLHVVVAGLRGLAVGVGVGEERLQVRRHLAAVGMGEAAAAGDDVLGLLELVVVGAEEDGLAEGDGFQYVVDAHTEAAADIGHIGIAVELGEDADVVDDEDFFSVEC